MKTGCGVLLWIALAVAGTAFGGKVPPYKSPQELAKITEEERRVWDEADEFDREIKKSGLLYHDKALESYLERIAVRLFPEFEGNIRIKMIRAPYLNAFALPNGSIYVNEGLLARFRNEAQAATVLAHEISHFTHRHSYQFHSNLKNTGVFRLIASLLGLPRLLDILTVSSVYGYSRELESEADAHGYERLLTAGYDVKEAPKVFEHLMNEIKAADIKEPFFFSSHPKLQERLENYQRLSAQVSPGGLVRRQEYAALAERLKIDNLENELSLARFKHVLLALCDPAQLEDYPAHVYYYIGEAYRQRNAQGDDISAEQAYLQALESAPAFAPTYRALGVLYLKEGAYGDARQRFQQYLVQAPDAPDRQYVEQYLETVSRKLSAR